MAQEVINFKGQVSTAEIMLLIRGCTLNFGHGKGRILVLIIIRIEVEVETIIPTKIYTVKMCNADGN